MLIPCALRQSEPFQKCFVRLVGLAVALMGAFGPSSASARISLHFGFGVPIFAGPPVLYGPPAYYAPAPPYYYAPYYPPLVAAMPGSAPYGNGYSAGNCREYQTTVTIAGTVQKTVGTACQQPDGTWRIVN